MNKFAEWIESNDKKQRGVAEKLHISTSTLHDIIRKDHTPSLLLAYEIELYTKGAVTLYDWIDEAKLKSKKMNKREIATQTKKSSK
jgi:DNA-binding XRE family transcriptional regulator